MTLAALLKLGKSLDPFWVIACIVCVSGVIMLSFELGRYRGILERKARKR